jgi:hypothetical protein
LLFGALAGAFVFDVLDGQPEQFDGGVVVGEVPAVFDDLAELEVEGLDRVGGVDDLAEFRWEGASAAAFTSSPGATTATFPGRRCFATSRP